MHRKAPGNFTQVPKFKPRTIGDMKVVTSIGKSGSGKSQVTYNLLQYIKPDLAVVFAGTIGAYTLASKSIVRPLIFQGFSEPALKNLQTMMTVSKMRPDLGLPRTVEVVLDDLGTSGLLRKNNFLQTFFTESRHVGFGLKLCIHTFSQLKPEARDSFHVTLLYECGNYTQLQNLHKNFSTVDGKTFEKYMQGCTGDYSALVINNLPGVKKADSLAWYKADINQEMKQVGRDDIIEFCRRFCKPDSGWNMNESSAEHRMVLESADQSD